MRIWSKMRPAATSTPIVAPLLARRCLDCHSGPDPKGKLDLSRKARALSGGESGAAIVPGKPEDSLLWERVRSDEMPPKTPLPTSEKTLLRSWLAAGANWGTDPIDPYQVTTSRRAGRDWWSLQPVKQPHPPAVRPARLGSHADRSVHSRASSKQTGFRLHRRPTAGC